MLMYGMQRNECDQIFKPFVDVLVQAAITKFHRLVGGTYKQPKLVSHSSRG